MVTESNGGVPAAQELETFLTPEEKNKEIIVSKYNMTKDAESSEFDPFAARNLENPTSDMDTLTHLLKASLGTGILAMPLAFKCAGLVTGILFTVLVAVVCTHCSYILIKCAHVLYKKTRRTNMTFPEVGEAAVENGPLCLRSWANAFRLFILISLFFTYFGTCSVYTVIIAKNIRQVVITNMRGPVTHVHMNETIMHMNETIMHMNKTNMPMNATNMFINATNMMNVNETNKLMNTTNMDIIESNGTMNASKIEQNDIDIDIRIFIIVLLPPLIFMSWIRNLKYLAPVSMIANVFMCVGLGITFYYLVSDTSMTDNISNMLFKLPAEWPQFFSLSIFAMEAIGVVMPLENAMKTPRSMLGFCGVLNKGMSGVTVVYIILGFLGYLRYGEKVMDSITLNLEPTDILAQIVKVSIAIAVYCTFGLQFFVCVEIMWNAIKEKFTARPDLADYVMRTIMVTMCVLLAVAFPAIGPLMGVIGAFCFSILGLIAPAFIEVITYWNIGFGPCKYLLWKNALVLIFGVFALIYGTKDAILSLNKA